MIDDPTTSDEPENGESSLSQQFPASHQVQPTAPQPVDNPPLQPAYGETEPVTPGSAQAYAAAPPPATPQSGDGGGSTGIPNIIVVFNATADYVTFQGTITGPV